MRKRKKEAGGNPAGLAGEAEGARRATGDSPAREAAGPLEPGERWTAGRKRDAALRLLRGESAQALSRELGVEIYRLEEWRERALLGVEAAMKGRAGGATELELERAKKQLGELILRNELLQEGLRRKGGFLLGRSRK